MSPEPRENGLTLSQKQILMEMGVMLMFHLAERKQKRLNRILEKTRYLAGTSHDLLTPITGLQLALPLMKGILAKGSAIGVKADYIDTAMHCSEMMNILVMRSMNLFNVNPSKATASQILEAEAEVEEIILQKVSVEQIFQKVLSVVRSFPKASGVGLSLDVHNNCPAFICMPKDAEGSVYSSALNYCTNALKATTEGHVRLIVRKITGNRLLVECEDTGPGVNSDNYSQLFVPSSAVNKSTLGGKGLGLYSTATHVTSLGGKYGYRPLHATVEMTYRPGAHESDDSETSGSSPSSSMIFETAVSGGETGSVFWFWFPYTPAEVVPPVAAPLSSAQRSGVRDKDTIAGAASRELRIASQLKSPTKSEGSSSPAPFSSSVHFKRQIIPKVRQRCALVIDDSIVIRKPLSKAVELCSGFKCESANDGFEGLQKMKDRNFDVVFCDFLMPITTGMSCVSQLRQFEAEHPDKPRQLVYGISANAGGVGEAIAEECGMDGFHTKPISFELVGQICKSEEVSKQAKILDKDHATLLELEEEEVVASRNLSPSSFLAKPRSILKSSSSFSPKVLIAGDLPSSGLLVTACESQGLNPIIVSDGTTLLQTLKESSSGQFDLVLVD
jgi:signal transduction histidine kinase/CheY-like chemotaxis protein